GDSNIRAVFIHALMDALSSLVVMIIGFIARYAGRPGQLDFTDYLDAITSVVMALMT
ncbi:unnamed protein product, partial [Heterosigma akashiwo]